MTGPASLTSRFCSHLSSLRISHPRLSAMPRLARNTGDGCWRSSASRLPVLAPVLGAVADGTGSRRAWIFAFAAMCAAGAFALWWALPGGAYHWPLIFFGIGLIGAEFAQIFVNAMLPGPRFRQADRRDLRFGMGLRLRRRKLFHWHWFCCCLPKTIPERHCLATRRYSVWILRLGREPARLDHSQQPGS